MKSNSKRIRTEPTEANYLGWKWDIMNPSSPLARELVQRMKSSREGARMRVSVPVLASWWQSVLVHDHRENYKKIALIHIFGFFLRSTKIIWVSSNRCFFMLRSMFPPISPLENRNPLTRGKCMRFWRERRCWTFHAKEPPFKSSAKQRDKERFGTPKAAKEERGKKGEKKRRRKKKRKS